MAEEFSFASVVGNSMCSTQRNRESCISSNQNVCLSSEHYSTQGASQAELVQYVHIVDAQNFTKKGREYNFRMN